MTRSPSTRAEAQHALWTVAIPVLESSQDSDPGATSQVVQALLDIVEPPDPPADEESVHPE
jgi:hypothetical protein